MKLTKIIALAGVTSAIGVILLALGTYVELLDLSCLFMSSLVIMIPLAKKSVKSALLSYGATALISLLFTLSTGRFVMTVMFVVFFGLHPVINYIQKNRNWNIIVSEIIKSIWFVGSLFVMYYIFNVFVDLPGYIELIIEYVLSIGGFLLFFIYDYLMMKFQEYTDKIIVRLKV